MIMRVPFSFYMMGNSMYKLMEMLKELLCLEKDLDSWPYYIQLQGQHPSKLESFHIFGLLIGQHSEKQSPQLFKKNLLKIGLS